MRWKTHFRLPTKLRTPWAAHLLSIRPPDQEHDIHRLRPLPSSAIKCRAINAPTPAPSESGRRRARHAARTSLAHSTPWILCVSTHYPSDPPRSASPTDFGGSLRKPLENASFPPALGPKPSSTNFQHISELDPVPQSDLRGALPKVLILSCFSTECCLHALDRQYSSPASIAAVIFQRAFAFWASCGFLTLYNAWQKACQSASTKEGPHLSFCNVVDVDT